MSTLVVRLEGMHMLLNAAPLAAELAHVEVGAISQFNISQDAPRSIPNILPGHYAIKVYAPWGATTSVPVTVQAFQDAEVIVAVMPEEGFNSGSKFEGHEDRTINVQLWRSHGKMETPYSSDGRPNTYEPVREWINEPLILNTEYKGGFYQENGRTTIEMVQNSLASFRSCIQMWGDGLMSRCMILPPNPVLRVTFYQQPVYEPDGYSGEEILEHEYITDTCKLTATSTSFQAEMLLKYLRAGDLRSAQTVGAPLIQEQINSLSHWGKINDLVTAIICGYFSLRVGSFSTLQTWSDAFWHLAKISPDAAIIIGWHLLETGHRSIAREFFIDAASMTLPVYTEGLRLLYDGLRLIRLYEANNHANEELDIAIKSIEPYAISADWGQTLTTFYGTSPESPSLKNRFKPPDVINFKAEFDLWYS